MQVAVRLWESAHGGDNGGLRDLIEWADVGVNFEQPKLESRWIATCNEPKRVALFQKGGPDHAGL